MKKRIALFLAMLMVFSVIPLAFAENKTEGVTDDSVDAEPVVTIVPGDIGTTDVVDGAADAEDAAADEAADEVAANDTTEEETIELPEEVTEEAGITPDSPLYGLERAIERISLALTFGRSAKAKKGLAHARERLMEVQIMIAAKKMSEAVEAQEAYEDTMEEVEENIAELEDGDVIAEFQDEVEIENALAENDLLLKQVSSLKTKFKRLTPEQEAQITSIVSNLGDSTSAVKVQVQAKKNKTKIKIKAQGEMTDEEVAKLEEDVKTAIAAGENVKVKIKVKGNKEKSRAETKDEDEIEADIGVEDKAEDEGNLNEIENKGKGKGKK